MEEIWKDIPGYEGIYMVSTFGRIKSLARINSYNREVKEKILKGRLARGYLKVALFKNGFRKEKQIHQLVCICFLNHKPNGMNIVINHKNEIKTDNRIENLEIVSQRYNVVYSRKNKTGYTGVKKTRYNTYQARIIINSKQTYLGNFKTAEQASIAYMKAYYEVEGKESF